MTYVICQYTQLHWKTFVLTTIFVQYPIWPAEPNNYINQDDQKTNLNHFNILIF